jgi:hypothetical protein
VQLRHSWYGGVTALVELPGTLLVRPAGVPAPALATAGAVAHGGSNGNGHARHQISARDVSKAYVPLRRHATHPGAGMALPPAPRRPAPREADEPRLPEPHDLSEPFVVPEPEPDVAEAEPVAFAPEPPEENGPLPRRTPGAARTADAAHEQSEPVFETAVPPAPATPPSPPEPVAVAEAPSATAGGASGGVTATGLPRRIPRANLAPAWVAGPGSPAPPGASGRSPDEVRSMLSSYRTGIERGRHESEDLPPPPGRRGPVKRRRPGPGSGNSDD